MTMFEQQIKDVQKRLLGQYTERETLRNLDLFVLDNSLRETTVGQLRGHTIEDKWKIYEQVKKVGFKNLIVHSFSHMTQVGDTFIKQLKDKGEDMSRMYAFAELIEEINLTKPQTDVIPIGLLKMKELEMTNVILEVDLVYHGIDYSEFNGKAMFSVFSKRFQWIRDNLAADSRILVNLRDFADAMTHKPNRVFKVVNHLSSLSPEQRPFGIIFEEPTGKYLPEELGVWTAAVREEMNRCGFQSGHLLVHVHEQWGMQDVAQLQCLMNGANGIWAGICAEGAAMGHACSTVTLMNFVRLGNKKVLRAYNCPELRNAARVITKVTTGRDPAPKQPIYGDRALDAIFSLTGMAPGTFSMATFFGKEPIMRMSTLASPDMVVTRLNRLFGSDPQFTKQTANRMREVMLEDLNANRKEEYMSSVGIALLFDRSGGHLTQQMRDVIAKTEPNNIRIEDLIGEVRKTWNEWNLRDIKTDKDCLEFDSFYSGFLAPYFGCYRCSETRKALQAIDMDSDGKVQWSEFSVYLKWAGREYPDTKDAEELLSIAFCKGIIPAMQDEILRQIAQSLNADATEDAVDGF